MLVLEGDSITWTARCGRSQPMKRFRYAEIDIVCVESVRTEEETQDLYRVLPIQKGEENNPQSTAKMRGPLQGSHVTVCS
jgi:hypothetical protein